MKTIIYVKCFFIVLLSFAMSCSSDKSDEPSMNLETIDVVDLVGVWTDGAVTLNIMENGKLTFGDNNYNWQYDSETRNLKCYAGTLHAVSYEIIFLSKSRIQLLDPAGKKYSFKRKVDDNEKADDADAGDNTYSYTSKSAKKFYGEWSDGDDIYVFLSNGDGFYQYERSDYTYHVYYNWKVTGKELKMIFHYKWKSSYSSSDIERVYTYSIKGKNLSLTDEKGKEQIFNQIDTNSITSIDYKEGPFDCFLLDKGDSKYYPILSAIERCDHASAGEKTNWKELIFVGNCQYWTETGFRFFYTTPYYEGINSYWSEGTYTITLDSGYYKYGGFGHIKGQALPKDEGKLSIRKSGKNVKYYFDGYEYGIQFIGTVK